MIPFFKGAVKPLLPLKTGKRLAFPEKRRFFQAKWIRPPLCRLRTGQRDGLAVVLLKMPEKKRTK